MLHAEPDYQHRTPAPQLSLLAGHYEPGSLRRVRPTRAPHVATIAVRPSEPRRHRQLSRSRSTSNCRSRSHRRRRTRRSRSSSSRSFRRRARSRCPSRRSNATRATHTTATEISPISSAVYPENPQFPANAWLTPPSSFIGNAVTPKASPEVVPAVLSPYHPRPQVIPPETSPFFATTLRVDGPTPPAPGISSTTPPPPSPPPSPSPPSNNSPGSQTPVSPTLPPAHTHPTSLTRPAHPATPPSTLHVTRTVPPPPPPPATTVPQSSNDSGPMTPQMLAHTVAMSSAGPISACDPQGIAAASAIRRARLTLKLHSTP